MIAKLYTSALCVPPINSSLRSISGAVQSNSTSIDSINHYWTARARALSFFLSLFVCLFLPLFWWIKIFIRPPRWDYYGSSLKSLTVVIPCHIVLLRHSAKRRCTPYLLTAKKPGTWSRIHPQQNPDSLRKLIDLSREHRRHSSLKISSKSVHKSFLYILHKKG